MSRGERRSAAGSPCGRAGTRRRAVACAAPARAPALGRAVPPGRGRSRRKSACAAAPPASAAPDDRPRYGVPARTCSACCVPGLPLRMHSEPGFQARMRAARYILRDPCYLAVPRLRSSASRLPSPGLGLRFWDERAGSPVRVLGARPAAGARARRTRCRPHVATSRRSRRPARTPRGASRSRSW